MRFDLILFIMTIHVEAYSFLLRFVVLFFILKKRYTQTWSEAQWHVFSVIIFD